MASSSNSFSESSFLAVNIKNYVPITLKYTNYKPYTKYWSWKSQIIKVLKEFKLDGHITGQSVCPSLHLIDSSGEKKRNPDYSSWIQKENTVINWLKATLSPDIYKNIHDINIDFPTERQMQLSARQIWLAIEKLFKDLAEPSQLQRERAIEHLVPVDSLRANEYLVPADWSQLPQDLLHSIAERLEICFDFTHFRSVCSSWRSLVPPKPCLLPASFPLTSYDPESIKSFYLSKRIIVLVRDAMNLDKRVGDPWLVKMEGKGIMHLLHPLSNPRINGFRLFDFMNCQIIELSRQYVVHYEAYYDHPLEPGDRGYTRKVAFMCSSTGENYYVLLVDHWDRNFAMFSSRDKQWTILENTAQSYEDIISFNGKFYVLDKEGRTMVVEVEPSLNVSFLAIVDSGTERQFFVESAGQLLLVQRFLAADLRLNMARLQDCFRSPMEMVWFTVYKLYEAEQEWEHVKRLGDHILFLGKDGAFSTSTSELPWIERNSIVFSSNNFDGNGVEDMFVYNYEDDSDEDGRVKPLKNYPGFSTFFFGIS